jgi:aspartokinase-like uncharacterized kinase
MALLAMHQTGMMLAGMHARLVPVETLAEMRRTLAESRIPVWLPLKLSADDALITPDWRTTSDGLAARLAERLGRVPVVLVKSCRIQKRATLATLARDGVVDPAFAAIVERARLDWRIFGPGDEDELRERLKVPAANTPSGVRERKAGRRRGAARAIGRRR